MTTSPLPPLYARWIEEALAAPIPNESRATCNTCAMIPGPVERADDPPPVAFRPDTKCCTYQPELYNFLVGAILDDPDRGTSWAKEVLSMRFRQRTGVTPFGVRPEAFGSLLYERVVEPSHGGAFGRMKEVRCPYFIQQGGMCGVWKHRNAICSTWFCKYERGNTGLTFWKTLLGTLRSIESALSMWCIHELDPGPAAKAALLALAQRPDGVTRDHIEGWGDATYRTLWGTWHGREKEFFRACTARVEALAWADVRRIAGPELGMFESILRSQFESLRSTEFPAQVTPNPDVLVQIHPRKPRMMRTLSARLGYDPLDVPAELFAVLPELAGRDPRVALDELHASGRVPAIDDAMLRRLLDYGVLVPT